MSDPLDFAIALAREAGQIQRSRLHSDLHIERKKGQEINLVTEVDHQIDQMLVKVLRQQFPSHAVVSEEGELAHVGSSATDIWYVDPLDGTTNYSHRYPTFAVSLAWWQRGQPLLGVIFDVNRNELFTAKRGEGAFLNGRRLHVSPTAQLSDALLSTGFPYDREINPDNNFAQFSRVIRHAQSVRRQGAAARDLAWLAAGRLDGHWERGLGPWDAAAAVLMIAEAGGRVTTETGAPWAPTSRWLVATNGSLHDQLLGLLGAAPSAQSTKAGNQSPIANR